jgi:transposase-like protein
MVKVNANSKFNPIDAAELHRAGKTTREIAAHFGVQPPAITRALNKVGVKLRKGGGMSAARKDRLAELVADGASLQAAADTMGVTLPHIKKLWGLICAGMGRQAV